MDPAIIIGQWVIPILLLGYSIYLFFFPSWQNR